MITTKIYSKCGNRIDMFDIDFNERVLVQTSSLDEVKFIPAVRTYMATDPGLIHLLIFNTSSGKAKLIQLQEDSSGVVSRAEMIYKNTSNGFIHEFDKLSDKNISAIGLTELSKLILNLGNEFDRYVLPHINVVNFNNVFGIVSDSKHNISIDDYISVEFDDKRQHYILQMDFKNDIANIALHITGIGLVYTMHIQSKDSSNIVDLIRMKYTDTFKCNDAIATKKEIIDFCKYIDEIMSDNTVLRQLLDCRYDISIPLDIL